MPVTSLYLTLMSPNTMSTTLTLASVAFTSVSYIASCKYTLAIVELYKEHVIDKGLTIGVL